MLEILYQGYSEEGKMKNLNLILTGQKAVNNQYSRFLNHPVYIDPQTSKKFIGTWNPPEIPTKETDKTFYITHGFAYRPDAISYEFYDTPLLAWAICYANNITNPLDKTEGLYVGRVITIPDLSTLSSLLIL